MKKIEDEQIKESLYLNAGILTDVAKALDCSYELIRLRVSRSAELQAARVDAREQILDLAESKLIQNIKDNDKGSIYFFLKTQGKARGYIESVALNGNFTGDFNVNNRAKNDKEVETRIEELTSKLDENNNPKSGNDSGGPK